MSQEKFSGPPHGGCGRPLPQRSDWHFNCLETIGRWWPGTPVGSNVSAPTQIVSSTGWLNDQVQARVYLARRIYADTKPARQDADQGIRIVPDPRLAPAVGLRRFVDEP